MTSEDVYYLQDSRKYVGNSVIWWADGGGYTCDPGKARKFTKKDADGYHRSRKSDVPWPAAQVEKAKSYHVDIQELRAVSALVEAHCEEEA